MITLANTSRPITPLIPADQPLRIGFFSDTYAPQVNGIAVSLQLLVRGLRAAGQQVTVFAPRYPGHHDDGDDVVRLPAVRYMQKPPVYLALPGTPRTTLALRRRQLDIVHVHSPLSAGLLAYAAARAKHVPLVYTYHTAIADYTHYLKWLGRTRPVVEAAEWFSTATANLGDQIITPSDKFHRLLESQNVRRPIHTINNGIDLSRFYQPQTPGMFRGRLGLTASTPVLVSVGRQDPEKRLDFLIAAFTRIAASRPDVHFVLAGDGSSHAGLQAQAAASGFGDRVHFLGMLARADLPGLLQEADLFVSASTSEVQSLAMMEAIASGLPVAAVADDAFDGILVDGVNGRSLPRDIGAFAATVCDLLNAPETLRSFGRNSVELSRKYAIDTQVQALIRLYRQAILERAPAWQ
jgi:1,2-diacylglycerol 3-alpha-glucosyltransferase